MRVALISDLHANVVALEAVLADIARRGADRVVCLGDVATLGSRPAETLQLLEDRRIPCIEGNHDAFLTDRSLVASYTELPLIVDAIDWCRDQLGSEELAHIERYASDVEIEMGGGATLYLFHGTPRSHMEDLLATTPPEQLDEMLGGRVATVMAGGHTHLQMIRQHRGILLVNPGSVGSPFREYVTDEKPTLLPDFAEYAIVDAGAGAADLGVELRRVPLDRRAIRDDIAERGGPIKNLLLGHYL